MEPWDLKLRIIGENLDRIETTVKVVAVQEFWSSLRRGVAQCESGQAVIIVRLGPNTLHDAEKRLGPSDTWLIEPTI